MGELKVFRDHQIFVEDAKYYEKYQERMNSLISTTSNHSLHLMFLPLPLVFFLQGLLSDERYNFPFWYQDVFRFLLFMW